MQLFEFLNFLFFFDVTNRSEIRIISSQNLDNETWSLQRETILALEIEELLAKLKNGELDPVAVLEAYQARALEATEATNCVVDFMLEARTQARCSNWQNKYIFHKLCKIKNSKLLL